MPSIGIKVFIIKKRGYDHSASGNRQQMMIRMIKSSFEVIKLEKKFSKIRNPLLKILYGFFYRFQIGLLALKIPKSSRYEKNVIILFSTSALTALIAKLISLFKGNKLIIERNEYPALFRNTGIIQKKLFEYFILSWQYKLYDGLFLMTDELIRFYKKFARKDCSIQKLPMTVDFSRFANIETKFKDKYIAYTGSLSNEKDGIIHLLKAFKEFSEKRQDIKLKIAGGKPGEIKNLIKLSTELNIFERIDFLGILEGNLIPYFIQKASVLVLPRPDSIQARGGFPTKLGEYLATSQPVIVTRVGEIPYYLAEDEVFFINSKNIKNELVDTLEFIFSNYTFALKVGKKGYHSAFKKFSLEVNKDKVVHLINTVANSS